MIVLNHQWKFNKEEMDEGGYELYGSSILLKLVIAILIHPYRFQVIVIESAKELELLEFSVIDILSNIRI